MSFVKEAEAVLAKEKDTSKITVDTGDANTIHRSCH